MPYTPELDRLLRAGSEYADEHARYVVEPHDLGEAVLPSGRVVGCDPLVNAGETEPYSVAVPPGRYPLRAWVAVLYRDDAEYDRRVAALQLVVRDEPAARWEMAVPEGNDLADLGDDEYFGYPVDAGTGTLADADALDALAEWDEERVEEVYVPEELPEAPVPGAVAAVTDPETGGNVVVVSSGWGDGCYPTFIGYTAAGEVASFVTDFMAVPEDESP